ncbi:hypothetical protein L3X38_025595 [Prunus dulcis]|uniref:RNase H type-1 domain-containing protein n=1 Tax=Prunus dulcis TaxID=3755 RepID=A0AAD4W4P8_PRUDU|nr:hypothetical protein L3X38_025595 [Prunus dulcis]
MRGIHWTKWETICVSKQIGGLGFRDLEAFNHALLAKQSWRLFFKCNSLAARVFKALYFPHCNFLEARLGYRPSRIWSSLIWGNDLLKAGLRWRVGNGEDIYVYQDRWVPLPINFKIISTPQFDISMKVCELFNAAGQWDEELLKANFWEQEVKAILQIPLASNHREDKLIWHYDQSGKYSVRSGYMVACMKKQRENGMEGSSTQDGTLLRKKLWSLQTQFYSVNLAPICSHIGKGLVRVLLIGMPHWMVCTKLMLMGAAKLAGLVRGVGEVIRNGNKEFTAACSRQVVGHFSAQAMELIAAKEGLQFAYDLGFRDIVLEMDAQGVVDRIKSNEECFEAEGNLVEDIKEMQGWFRYFSCNWQRREGNKVAHELAQYGTRNAGFFTWIEEEPLWLTPFLSADLEANG